MEIMEGIDKLFIQNYEQKEVNPSRVIGGASCPPAELESPEGPVYDRDHAQFEETDRSENWENFKKIMCVLCRNRC